MTPPPPDPSEILISSIKDFLHAIKKYHLTGELLPPSLVQDLQDLAPLHSNPQPAAVSPVLAPEPVQKQRVPPIFKENVQEQRVVPPSDTVKEQRVVPPIDQAVQEIRVVLPTLASANPAHTAPVAPIPIVALTSPPYSPPPGLPPLPNTSSP